MDKEELSRLIGKYKANTLSAEERTRLDAWFNSFPDTEATVPVSSETTEEAVGKELLDKITRQIQKSARPRAIISPLILKMAAAVTLLVVSVYVISINSAALENWLRPVHYTEVHVPRGRQMQVTLPDGTRVDLNANSTLRYATHFTGSTREVTLTGEGFFEVVRNEKKPFKIHTGKVETQVLGTSFNVRAKDYDFVEVTVRSGRVQVAVNDSSEGSAKVLAIISRHERVTYDAINEKSFITKNIDSDSIAPWKHGILEFRSNTLQEVIAELETWYDIRIELSDDRLTQCRFNGRFKKLSLTQVMDILAASSGFEYEIGQRTVKISGGMSCKK